MMHTGRDLGRLSETRKREEDDRRRSLLSYIGLLHLAAGLEEVSLHPILLCGECYMH